MSDATKPLLEVSGLKVEFTTQDGVVTAVQEANLTIGAGETLAIVGESGSGKSTTAMAVIGLLPGNGRVTAGSIRLDGEELVGASETKMRTIRGGRIGLVPQLPVLRIVAAGNVAGEGAKMALLSVRERAGALALLEEVTYVELSDRPDFNDAFVEQLSFHA